MNLVRRIMFVLAITFALPIQAEVTHVNNDELANLIDQGVPVIDVRRADEWRMTGTIEGSHLMTFFDKNGRYDAKAWLTQLNKIVSVDEPFVLLCAAGVRSRNIAQLLDKRLGYTAVHNAQTGIGDWINSGQAVIPYQP